MNPFKACLKKHQVVSLMSAALVASGMPNISSLNNAIQIGMTRADVERSLPRRDSGPQSIRSTRYWYEGYTIEVPYDQTGGTWSLFNHVAAPPVINPQPRPTFE